MSTVLDEAGAATTSELRVGGPLGGRQRRRSRALVAAPFVGLVVFFGLWEAYVRAADLRRLTLPTPSSIVDHMAGNVSFYADQGWLTLGEAAMGFVLALLVAFAVAVPMVHSRFLAEATIPLVVLLVCTPVAALTPVFLLWFGFGVWPMVLTATLFVFPLFVTNVYTGLRSIDANTLELLASVDASRTEILLRLRLPQCLPFLFAAFRYAVGLSLVGAFIGETLGGARGGLGYQIRSAQARSLVDQLWGSIFTLALIGVTFTLLVGLLERVVLRWHSSQS